MPIAGCTPASGADTTPASPAMRDAEAEDDGEHGPQADAERAHHLGIGGAGAHDHAERGPVQQQPGADHHEAATPSMARR